MRDLERIDLQFGRCRASTTEWKAVGGSVGSWDAGLVSALVGVQPPTAYQFNGICREPQVPVPCTSVGDAVPKRGRPMAAVLLHAAESMFCLWTGDQPQRPPWIGLETDLPRMGTGHRSAGLSLEDARGNPPVRPFPSLVV